MPTFEERSDTLGAAELARGVDRGHSGTVGEVDIRRLTRGVQQRCHHSEAAAAGRSDQWRAAVAWFSPIGRRALLQEYQAALEVVAAVLAQLEELEAFVHKASHAPRRGTLTSCKRHRPIVLAVVAPPGAHHSHSHSVAHALQRASELQDLTSVQSVQFL